VSKIEKLLERLLSNPKDFTWDELINVLAYFGYRENKGGKTGGSRRKFIDAGKNIISLHKPHPGNILKTYAIKEIRKDDEIKSTKLNSYFSFMRGAKSANSELFKDFCNEAEMEKNS